jgi:hypothetical protein
LKVKEDGQVLEIHPDYIVYGVVDVVKKKVLRGKYYQHDLWISKNIWK